MLSLTKNIFDYQNKLNFYQGFKKDYDKEQKSNIELKTKILKNRDPYEIEKTIRNQLNLSKQGELSVIVPNPTPTPVIIIPTMAPVYRQWLTVFFQN